MPSTAEGRARRETGVLVILRRVGPFCYPASYPATLFLCLATLFPRAQFARGKIRFCNILVIDLRSGYCCL